MEKYNKYITQKLTYLLFTFVFTLFMSNVFTQITIERIDFTLDINTPVTDWNVNLNNIDIPSEGANQIWDYSDISYSNSYTYSYEADTHPSISSVNQSYSGGDIQFGDVVQPRKWYETLETDQYATMGMTTEPVSASLSHLTGNVNDSIKYLGEQNIYSEPLYYYKWPLNFNDSWNTNITSFTDATVSISSFSLNNAIVKQVATDIRTVNVSGYGTLLIPNPNDTGILSIEVLLIKEEVTLIDSSFLNGQPTATNILNQFNITQGEITTTVNYQFVAKNLPNTALYIQYENGVKSFAAVSNEVRNSENSVAISSIYKDRNDVRLFPNPITDVSKISFENEWIGNVTINIVNTLGENVQSISLEKINPKQSSEFNLTELPIGMYRAIISYEDEVVVKSFVKMR